MKVFELIQALQSADPNATVHFHGTECDETEVSCVFYKAGTRGAYVMLSDDGQQYGRETVLYQDGRVYPRDIVRENAKMFGDLMMRLQSES